MIKLSCIIYRSGNLATEVMLAVDNLHHIPSGWPLIPQTLLSEMLCAPGCSFLFVSMLSSSIIHKFVRVISIDLLL